MMKSSSDIFAHYEGIKQRLPTTRTQPTTIAISSLMDIADQVDAFVFDAFGVLNIGEHPIPGAIARLAQLRATGLKLRVLTNAASYNQHASLEKFNRLGFSFGQDEIITSRSAALNALDDRLWGVIADETDPLTDIPYSHTRLKMRPEEFSNVEGFLFLSTAHWTQDQQTLLEHSIANSPRRIVIANADLAAPRGSSFSIEPGYWGHQIADRIPQQVEFFGKPFDHVFELVQNSLPNTSRDKIALCGDSLHTDVLGANAMGWKSVFVTQDGLFKDLDPHSLITASHIHPDWQTLRI